MNAYRQQGAEPEHQLMGNQFPAAATRGLSPARMALLEEQLMREISRAEPAPAAVAPRRRARWGLVAVPVTVTAAAAVVLTNIGGPASPSAPYTALSPVVKVQPASAEGTTELMREVADATRESHPLTVRSDQYVYIRSKVGFSRQTAQRTMNGPTHMDAVHEREVWLPQDPARAGLIREAGKDERLAGTGQARVDGGAATTPGAGNATYAQTAALPTDPDTLLETIYTVTAGRAPSRDAAAFDWIGDTIDEAIVPPRNEAAIWLAAAKIPGVAVVHDAVDAAGRHGEALAFESLGERTEYIFDTTTHTYLGERSYLVKNTPAGKAGQLTGISAILDRGVTDRLGLAPADTDK
ncbi:CU044_5270 family protein [Streptomyces sp. NPDC047841]|uniref:CU044_5270 family protein n=1 Tax=Streptomyces sp. NPDC047841 TaxID=3154708 RepID=UPI003452E5E2